MELLDVYDSQAKKTGRVVERGKDNSFTENEHIAVAIIFIENSNNEFLIQKTSTEKGGEYSSTGGHVNHGEEPINTIIREVKEELGIEVKKEEIIDLGYQLFDFPIRFFYYLKKDIDLNEITIQEEEVESVSYKTIEEINNIINQGLMNKAHGILFQKLLEYKEKIKSI